MGGGGWEGGLQNFTVGSDMIYTKYGAKFLVT